MQWKVGAGMSDILSIPNNIYTLLDGRLKMLSADGGYRAAIDPVLLAASISIRKGEQILDMGCGTGAATLCLAIRNPFAQAIGVDNQAMLIDIAKKIATLNRLEGNVEFKNIDLLDLHTSEKAPKFDHVMANPPYMKKGSVRPSPDPLKVAANIENNAVLIDWLRVSFKVVAIGGTVTFIHRYERRDELIAVMEKYGSVSVFPIWSRMPGKTARRVIIKCRKGASDKTKILDGLILHRINGDYTDKANAILRGLSVINI
ncbi:MAG: methyltransferase [Rhodospirillaceae bacterium]|nr:methyltransferase [Rhodospirillaceae bacterium]